MKLSEIVSTLTGFTPADQERDFGLLIPYVAYHRREKDGKHEYLTLISYSTDFIGKTAAEIAKIDGDFVEGIYEVFLAQKVALKTKGKQPKNMKLEELQKAGYAALSTQIFRSPKEIETILSKT